MSRYTHLGTARIAAKLHVATTTITTWIARYADTHAPFPEADVTIEHGDGLVRGWAKDRWPEIERWYTVDRHTVRRPGTGDS